MTVWDEIYSGRPDTQRRHVSGFRGAFARAGIALLAVLLLGVGWSPAPAAEGQRPSTQPSVQDEDERQSMDVAVVGDRLALGVGDRVVVLSLDGSGSLVPQGRTESLPGQVTAITSVESRVYVGFTTGEPEQMSGGVGVVDVQDPASPSLRYWEATLPPLDVLAGQADSVYVAGTGAQQHNSTRLKGHVTVLVDSGGSLRERDVLDFQFPISALALVGDELFAAESRTWVDVTTLRHIDVSDRTQPVRLQALSLAGLPADLTAIGDQLLVSAGRRGLHAVAQNPGRPMEHMLRWDPRGCVTATVPGETYVARLDGCNASVEFIRTATFAGAGRAGWEPAVVGSVGLPAAPTKAAWLAGRLVVAMGGHGGAAVVEFGPGGGRVVSEYVPSKSDFQRFATSPGRSLAPADSSGDRVDISMRAKSSADRIYLPYLAARSVLIKDPRLVRRGLLSGMHAAVVARNQQLAYAGEGSSVVVFEVQDGILRLAGRSPDLGAPVRALDLEGERLYAALGESGFAILDITDATHPVELARVPTGSWAMDLDVDPSGTVLVAAMDAGLEAYSVVDDAPARLDALRIGGRARVVTRYGSAAYVGTADWAAPTVVDVSDPASLSATMTVTTTDPEYGWLHPMFTAQEHLYGFSCPNCLEIFDLSEPLAPVSTSRGEFFDFNGPHGVSADGGSRAFVGSNRITELDLTDPRRPTEGISTEPIGNVTDLSLSGDQLFAALSAEWDQSDEDDTFEVAPGGVGLIDVDPCCVPVDTYWPDWNRAELFASRPGTGVIYALVESPSGDGPERRVVDLTNPQRPAMGASVDAELWPGLVTVGQLGLQPVAGEEPGLRVYDLTEPRRPVAIGFHATAELPRAQGIGADRALIWPHAFWNETTPTTLTVSDLTDTPPFQLRGSVTVDGPVRHVVPDGQLVYIVASAVPEQGAVTNDRLHVLDLGDPDAPRVVGGVALGSRTYAAARVSPRHVLVAEAGGLAVVAVDEPTNPVRHELRVGRSFTTLSRVRGDIWLAAGDGMVLYDFNNPLKPRTLSRLEELYLPTSDTWQVVVHDGWVYVGLFGTDWSGTAVIEVTGLR